MKSILALLVTSIFIFLLLGIYAIHVLFFRVDVVLYSAIFDAIFAAIIAFSFLVIFVWQFNQFEKILLFIVWILSGYAFAITVPAVLDRSLSVYTLEKIQQRGGRIKLDSIAEIFITEYVLEHRLVDVRLTEQLASGTIVIENGCVILTERGKKITLLSRYFRQNWLPKKRLLVGEYSDILTDPFRNSPKKFDYACN